MRIRMVKLAAGPEGVWPVGMEVVVDDVAGRAMCEAGAAVPIPGQRETAVVRPDEVRDGEGRLDREEREKGRKARNVGKTAVSPIDPMPNNAEDEDGAEIDEDERPKRRAGKPGGGKKPSAG